MCHRTGSIQITFTTAPSILVDRTQARTLAANASPTHAFGRKITTKPTEPTTSESTTQPVPIPARAQNLLRQRMAEVAVAQANLQNSAAAVAATLDVDDSAEWSLSADASAFEPA